MSASIHAPAGRLRILFLINNMGYGGAEVQVAQLAKALVQRGHFVTVAVLLTFVDLRSDLHNHGVKTVELDMKGPLSVIRTTRTLRSLIRSTCPDIVHTHLFWSNVLGRLLHAVTPQPVLIGTSHTPYESRWRYSVYRMTDRWTDVWTNVCQAGLNTYVQRGVVASRKAVLMPNGINTATFTRNASTRARIRRDIGSKDGQFVWLSVGSFRDEQKDYDNLLQAFAALEQRDTALWIAGTGRLAQQKLELARALGVGDRAKFLGLRGDVSALMQAADAFVLASRWEAFPIVLLEAAASQLPIVCTNVGGNADIVEAHRTGYIVPSEDHKQLAQAMTSLMLLSASSRRDMGALGRSLVCERYDMDAITSRWEAMYYKQLSR